MLLSLHSTALINSFHIHPPGSKLGNKLHCFCLKETYFSFSLVKNIVKYQQEMPYYVLKAFPKRK